MKKMMSVLAALLMMAVSVYAVVNAETLQARKIILITEYQQMGWGERFQLGALDTDGNLWEYSNSFRDDVPYPYEELVNWAEKTDQLERTASVSDSALADIMSLVNTVPVQEAVCKSGACDAGVQASLAVRGKGDGNTEIIVLGVSGDDVYENSDPSAQSLYNLLRQLFPGITAYEGEKNMAPEGFQEKDLRSFCGYGDIDLTQYKLTAYFNDCEAGASETEPKLNAAEFMRMSVTGKRNSMCVTGNTITYCFTDPTGETVAAFEFYGQLLVRSDGMYTVQ